MWENWQDLRRGSLLLCSGKTSCFRTTRRKESETPFTLGPISLEMHPGELVFVIGGNGSGKSTFVKVLAGLYQPSEGTVTLAGTMITDANREWYREHFSVVFSDFHLFNKLLGQSDSQAERLAPQYLRLLHMDQKVTVHERTFSTSTSRKGSESGWRLSRPTWRIALSMCSMNGQRIKIRSIRKSFTKRCFLTCASGGNWWSSSLTTTGIFISAIRSLNWRTARLWRFEDRGRRSSTVSMAPGCRMSVSRMAMC